MNWLIKRKLGLFIAVIVIAGDYLTKQLALESLGHRIIEVIPNIFNLRLAWNSGVSFSMLSNHNWTINLLGKTYHGTELMPLMLSAFAIAVSLYFIYWLGDNNRKLFAFGMGAIIGGAIGNVWDRINYGAVIDFLDFYYGSWHFPTFNVADGAISIGVMLILLDGVMVYREEKARR